MSRVDDILQEANELLQTAEIGVQQVQSGPEGVKSGLRNVAVFGRMVTFALNNLRGKVGEFEDWDKEAKARFLDNPHCKHMVEVRNVIEKQARVPTSGSGVIYQFNASMLSRFPKPPNATSFFMGDNLGGSGWLVANPDGGEGKFYVDIPMEIGQFQANVATEKFGHADLKSTVESYLASLRAYLTAVEQFVAEHNK